MNKVALFFGVLLMTLQANAQSKNKSSYAMPSRDYVMLQAGYETWTNVPDSIKITGIGRAFNAYLCYDFPIMKSNFSFAAGLGVGISNVYFKNQQIILNDTATAIQFIPEQVDYKRFKLTTTYVEAPFELRFFENKENRNIGIKAAIGLKVGALVSSHTKGKRTLNNKPIIEKVSTKRYIETWRYALTGRVGWGNFSVYGSYYISNLFRINNGPENIHPIQLGICLSGL
ncbi:MAG: outer membrane beta-barrel protein [Chitinophagaceae bacterium]